MSRILVVEDEQHLADGLRFNLEAEGTTSTSSTTARTALRAARPATGAAYDLVILDVMLPGIDGFDGRVASCGSGGRFVPVLMLTARGRPEDVLRGFEAGADDYLPKPFELPILLARVRGLLRRHEWFRQRQCRRRAAGAPSTSSRSATRRIDFEQLEVRVGDKRMPLTLMEAALLRYLVQHEGQPVPRKEILEKVWGVHEDTDTRAIDNFIVRLRRYIEDEPPSRATCRPCAASATASWLTPDALSTARSTESSCVERAILAYAASRSLLQPVPAVRAIARRCISESRTCRSSARTATSIRACSPTTTPFPEPAALLVIPDHYIVRMLYSQGVPLESLGVPRVDGDAGRDATRARSGDLRRALPSLPRHAERRAGSTTSSRASSASTSRCRRQTADARSTTRSRRASRQPEFRPRALFERFNIEVLCTTDAATDRSSSTSASATRAGRARASRRSGPDRAIDILHRRLAATSSIARRR